MTPRPEGETNMQTSCTLHGCMGQCGICTPPASAPGSGETKPSGPAISYLLLYPALRDAARPCGYSLALHGSLNRDMDLIAIPWTDNAAPPEHLIAALKDATGLYFVEGWSGPHALPAGRIGYKLTPGGTAYIDISVLPPFVSIARARAEGEAKGRQAARLAGLYAYRIVKSDAGHCRKDPRDECSACEKEFADVFDGSLPHYVRRLAALADDEGRGRNV